MMIFGEPSHGRRAPLKVAFYSLAVFFLLFFALGQRSLSGSEDRWAEIARNMLLYGDWFHPVINGEVYFDKPLLSYWLIVVLAHFLGGLSEFVVRLPGALSALLTVFCVHRIALELFDRRVAWLSAGLTMTSYGFLFWSHTASAELSNLALISAAIAWFVHRRERHDFLSYLGFYLLCAIGCQLKGLTAIIVPLLVVFAWIARERRWKSHLNFAHLAAMAIAAGVFFLPYLGAATQALPAGIEAQHNRLSGLDLLIRENIVRFFEPFDHVAPFYSYLYEVPRIVFPWMFVFVAALVHYAVRYRRLASPQRWLLEAIGLIFLFFTCSGSRRWYYILPIMPFCMILLGAYLAEGGELKWRRIALRATLVVLVAGALALLAVPLGARFYEADLAVPSEFVSSAAIIAGGALVGLIALRKRRQLLPDAPGLPASVPGLLAIAALEMIVVFAFVLPGADRYRQLKPFALALAAQLQADERPAFYARENTTVAYYLNARKPIPVIASAAELPAGERWVIISNSADKENLWREFPSLRDAAPVLVEKRIAKKRSLDARNFVAYRLDPGSR